MREACNHWGFHEVKFRCGQPSMAYTSMSMGTSWALRQIARGRKSLKSLTTRPDSSRTSNPVCATNHQQTPAAHRVLLPQTSLRCAQTDAHPEAAASCELLDAIRYGIAIASVKPSRRAEMSSENSSPYSCSRRARVLVSPSPSRSGGSPWLPRPSSSIVM